ncbi:16659_t:CDS:1, partial [Funneliformis geosporum]
DPYQMLETTYCSKAAQAMYTWSHIHLRLHLIHKEHSIKSDNCLQRDTQAYLVHSVIY